MSSSFNKKGLYCGYDKNHSERQKEDYYATPTKEVINILLQPDIPDMSNSTILEPSCGGGHMIEGILRIPGVKLIASDIKDRGYRNENIELTYGLDFMADDYPYDKTDYVIMNPPYKLLEPFIIRALEIGQKGVLALCRLQVLEGQARFENIFKDNPPTDVYVYVDRIDCPKNGDFSQKGQSVQAYCWVLWNKEINVNQPRLHWIRRSKLNG